MRAQSVKVRRLFFMRRGVGEVGPTTDGRGWPGMASELCFGEMGGFRRLAVHAEGRLFRRPNTATGLSPVRRTDDRCGDATWGWVNWANGRNACAAGNGEHGLESPGHGERGAWAGKPMARGTGSMGWKAHGTGNEEHGLESPWHGKRGAWAGKPMARETRSDDLTGRGRKLPRGRCPWYSRRRRSRRCSRRGAG